MHCLRYVAVLRAAGIHLSFVKAAEEVQKKTQRPVQFEITKQTREAVAAWVKEAHRKPEQFLWSHRIFRPGQYFRIVGSWVGLIGLDPAAYGTHSLRRTKPTLIYRRTTNLRAVQLLLGHTKLESTVRYLGIEVDDALEIAEQTEVWLHNVGRDRRTRRSLTGHNRSVGGAARIARKRTFRKALDWETVRKCRASRCRRWNVEFIVGTFP
jgi:hypothetical protein